MQINDANLRLLYRGFNVLFLAALDATETVSDAFSIEIPSTHKIEEYDWLNAVPGMKELRGEMDVQNLSASQWTIRNLPWYGLVAVKEEDIEDDNYGLYNTLLTQMGSAAKIHKDELNFALLANGFATKCYTGGFFFSNGQKRSPNDAGFSNLLTAPLNAYAYQTARANLLSRRNSEGRPMNLGTKLGLVVGTALEPVAKNIVELDKVVQAVANADGAIVAAGTVDNVNKGTATVITSPWLPANVWFLLEIGKPVKPLIYQVNKKPILIAQTNPQQSDHVFEKHEFRYQAYGRYNAGFGLPDLAVGSTGVGAAIVAYP